MRRHRLAIPCLTTPTTATSFASARMNMHLTFRRKMKVSKRRRAHAHVIARSRSGGRASRHMISNMKRVVFSSQCHFILLWAPITGKVRITEPILTWAMLRICTNYTEGKQNEDSTTHKLQAKDESSSSVMYSIVSSFSLYLFEVCT